MLQEADAIATELTHRTALDDNEFSAKQQADVLSTILTDGAAIDHSPGNVLRRFCKYEGGMDECEHEWSKHVGTNECEGVMDRFNMCRLSEGAEDEFNTDDELSELISPLRITHSDLSPGAPSSSDESHCSKSSQIAPDRFKALKNMWSERAEPSSASATPNCALKQKPAPGDASSENTDTLMAAASATLPKQKAARGGMSLELPQLAEEVWTPYRHANDCTSPESIGDRLMLTESTPFVNTPSGLFETGLNSIQFVSTPAPVSPLDCSCDRSGLLSSPASTMTYSSVSKCSQSTHSQSIATPVPSPRDPTSSQIFEDSPLSSAEEPEMDEMEIALELVNHVDVQHATKTLQKLRNAEKAAQDAEAQFAKLTLPTPKPPRFHLTSFLWGCMLVVMASAFLLVGHDAPLTQLDTEEIQSQLDIIQFQLAEVLNNTDAEDTGEAEPAYEAEPVDEPAYVETSSDRASLYVEQIREESAAMNVLREERIRFYLDVMLELGPWTRTLHKINIDMEQGQGSSFDPEQCLQAWHASVGALRRPLLVPSTIQVELTSMLQRRLGEFHRPQVFGPTQVEGRFPNAG